MMEFVSTSSRFLGLRGTTLIKGSHNGVKSYYENPMPVWESNVLGNCYLKALPIAEKGSRTRYRVFSAKTELTLKSAGDEYHLAVWEASEKPLAILHGFHEDMKDIEKLDPFLEERMVDIDAWLDALNLA